MPEDRGSDNAYRHIHVDEDWKERVRREKEEHDRKSRERAEQARSPGLDELLRTLRPSLQVVVELLAAQAAVAIAEKRLDVARFWVDTLGILEQKTRGNLEADEQRLLGATLFQLRMACVDLAKQLTEARSGQAASPGATSTPQERA